MTVIKHISLKNKKNKEINGKNIKCKLNVKNDSDLAQTIASYEKKINRLLKLNQALLEINKVIIEKNDIIEICNLVLEKISIAMEKADIGCVLVLDEEDNLKIIASKGYDREQCKKFRIKLQDSFHYLMTQGKIDAPIVINNIQKFDWKKYTDYWKRSQNETEGSILIDENEEADWLNYSRVLDNAEDIKLESSLSTPILFDGRLFGFIDIDSTTNYAFDESDLEIMEYIKNQIEVGISKYKLYEQMIYLSRYDKLTNIYNRGYFEELFDDSLKQAMKKGGKFALVIFDFNGLKAINDTYGHLSGDELIKKFALILTSILNEKDYLGRLGGDEFAAVIYDANIDELSKKIEIINNNFIKNPIVFENNKISGSFSYGISNFSEDGIDYNSLFKKADRNMYDYKQKNK
jgi:diguanylate cyclase (GGDEF)-like protein